MKAVILAAGYGTRLERDLLKTTEEEYKVLLGTPKPLLPIAGIPLITRWIRIFNNNTTKFSVILVIVNDLHKDKYDAWLTGLDEEGKNVKLVSDGSVNNENRKGAVTAMSLAITSPSEHTLFVAGDTLFKEDFILSQILENFDEKLIVSSAACLVTSAPVADCEVTKHGIIEVSPLGQVTKFMEKPQPTETSSRLQCPCFYIISAESLPLIMKFLEQTSTKPVASRDATGNLIAFLIHMAPVYAHYLKGRYDVGGLQSYIRCNEEIDNKLFL